MKQNHYIFCQLPLGGGHFFLDLFCTSCSNFIQVSGVSKAADENKIQSGLSFKIPSAASGGSFERIPAAESESDSTNSVEFN